MAETSYDGLVTTGLQRESVSDALTAHVGGGQANALQLVSQINRVTTSGGGGTDSVKLPAVSVPGSSPGTPYFLNPVGLTVVIVNDTANSIQVFGAGTDTINGVATGTGVSQAANTTAAYRCISYSSGVGAWKAVLAGASTGDFTINSGNLVFTQAASRIVPGATSLSLRNNANTQDNLIVTDAGVATVRSGLVVTAGGLQISAGGLQINGAAGGANTAVIIQKSITGIADATFTDAVTVTIPNAAHGATILVTVVGSLGAGGAIGAFEASATLSGAVAVARTAGVNAVAVAATASLTASAAVAGAATIALAYQVSAIAGAVGATNTFTIQIRITKGSGASAAHTAIVQAEVLNSQATGITIS